MSSSRFIPRQYGIYSYNNEYGFFCFEFCTYILYQNTDRCKRPDNSRLRIHTRTHTSTLPVGHWSVVPHLCTLLVLVGFTRYTRLCLITSFRRSYANCNCRQFRTVSSHVLDHANWYNFHLISNGLRLLCIVTLENDYSFLCNESNRRFL